MSTDDLLLAHMLGRTIAQLDVMEAERNALAAAVQRVRDLHADSGDQESLGYRSTGYRTFSHYCLGCVASGEYAIPWVDCPTLHELNGR